MKIETRVYANGELVLTVEGPATVAAVPHLRAADLVPDRVDLIVNGIPKAELRPTAQPGLWEVRALASPAAS